MNLDDLSENTQRVLYSIRHVYDHNVENLEKELGRLLLDDLVVFAMGLAPLKERDRRATIYILLGYVRRALCEIEGATEYLALTDPASPSGASP